MDTSFPVPETRLRQGRPTGRSGPRVLRISIPTLAFVILGSLASGPVFGQSLVAASPDITIPIGPADLVTTDHDIALDNQLGIVALETLGVLPSSADVIAYAHAGGQHALAFDSTVQLTGGLVARPGDVVLFDGSTYSSLFVATDEGVPDGVRTDAISFGPTGLSLSFDSTVDLGGLVVADEDLVRWQSGTFSLAFDGSAAGIDPSADLDAAQDLGSGDVLVSFDVTGVVGGIVYDDEDVLRRTGGVWTLEFDASAADPDWAAADLDAMTVPEPGGVGLLGWGVLGLAGLGSVSGRRRSLRTRSIRRAGHASSNVPDARCRIPRPRIPASGSTPSFSPLLALICVLFSVLPFSARATDGVTEINQTCTFQTGCFPGDGPGLPVTINALSPRSFVLTSDLVLSVAEATSGVAAIDVTIDDVTIDLGGFSIVRSDCVGVTTGCALIVSGSTDGIRSSFGAHRGLVVRNGSIVGMGAHGIAAGPGSMIQNIFVRWNGGSGFFGQSPSLIVDCLAFGNGGVGLAVLTPSLGNGAMILVGNNVADNADSGFSTDANTAAVAVDNIAENNGNYGFQAGWGSVLVGNVAATNGNYGLTAFPGCVMEGNTSRGNSPNGFQTFAGCLLRGNVSSGNSNVGMILNAAAGYQGNVVSDNTSGTIVGGVNLGNNVCNGTTSCP